MHPQACGGRDFDTWCIVHDRWLEWAAMHTSLWQPWQGFKMHYWIHVQTHSPPSFHTWYTCLPIANFILPRSICSNSRMISWKPLILEILQFLTLLTFLLHSILLTIPHFSTAFSIPLVYLAVLYLGFALIWQIAQAHPLLKSTRRLHPTQQYAQVYPRALSLAQFFLFSSYQLSPLS